MPTADNRTEERAPVNFEVYYIHKKDYILSFSRNISLGGMFLCTVDPPEPGTKVRLIFPVEEFYQTEIMAIVIWVSRTTNIEESGMGVQFLSPLPPNLKETIMQHVKRVEIVKEFEGSA
jgi:hypothetical protein